MDASQMSRSELLDAAIQVLTRRLPERWVVERHSSAGDAEPADVIITAPSMGSSARLLVELKSSVSTRDVEALIGGPWRRWRRLVGNPAILLVAPYISPRVRQLLAEEGVSYVDVTGNARITLESPGVFIETAGADRDPRSSTPRSGIRGAKAGSVVRVLVDAAPPYTAAEVAKAAGVNEGYLSRILDTLDSEGLVDRERGGPITEVDWAAMIRRRAQALNLFRPVGTYRFVARQGTSALVERLRARPAAARRPPTVTGSFAAARVAPVAAPSLLVVYTMDPRELETELELLPAETGADTILIRPDNNNAFARADRDGGLAWAAPSQVAIDCLAGTGRMPSEGEALLAWMRGNEGTWRHESIKALVLDSEDEGG